MKKTLLFSAISLLICTSPVLASDNNVTVKNDNLWICTSAACALAGSPTGNGNLIIENKVGIGKFVPADKLDVFSASWAARFSTNATNYTRLSTNQIASFNDILYLNLSTTPSVFITNGGGNVGISNVAPRTKIEYTGTLGTTTASTTPPIAKWLFDEGAGNTAADSSGNGRTLTFAVTTGWGAGLVSNAAVFNTSRYMNRADATFDALTNFTAMAWVNKTGSGNTQIISKVSGNTGWALLTGNTGEVYCRTGNGSALTDSYTTYSPFVTSATGWTHVAIVKNGTSCTIFVNGLDRTNTIASHTLTTNTTALTIGARPDGFEPFVGSIDEARIYNYAMTTQQVRRAMAESGGADAMANTIGAWTSIYSYGPICTGNNILCNSNKGNVINGNMLYTDDFRWYGGPILESTPSYLYQYSAGATTPSSGTVYWAGNGTSWFPAGYLYGDSAANFGLLKGDGNWAVRITPSWNGMHIYTPYNSVGIAPDLHTALYVYHSYSDYTYANPMGIISIVSPDSAQTLINDSGGVTSAGMVFKRGGSPVWEVYNRSSDNTLNFKRTQISTSTYGLVFGAGTGERLHDTWIGGNLMLDAGGATTGVSLYGVYTKQTTYYDTWLRLVRNSDKTTYHDLAIGQFWALNADFCCGQTRYDIAEVTPVDPTQNLILGNIVSTNPDHSVQLTKSSGAYDQGQIGIISDINTASLTIAGKVNNVDLDKTLDQKPIALRGRVTTIVNLENGPIKRGDPLTASSTPGEAMKAIKPGKIISIAMEDFDGSRVNSTTTQIQIDGFQKTLEKTDKNTTEYRQFQNTINQLTATLPNGSGRILSYIDAGFQSPQSSESQLDQNLISSNHQQLEDLTKRLDKISK